MAQISRPFQIGLAAVVLLAGVWLFALQGHSTSTGSSAPTSASATVGHTGSASAGSPATAAAEAKAAAAPTPVYHGSAPGVEGLTRAINKAHGAVATSQSEAKQLAQQSAQASDEPTSGAGSAAASAHSATPVSPSSAATSTVRPSTASPSVTAHTTAGPGSIKSQPGSGRTPARQALVERALTEGKVAVILFWNPKGADDVAVSQELRLLEAVHHLIRPFARVPQVRRELEQNGEELQKSFAAFQATANQVSSFGSITRDLQLSVTPTLYIINKRGETIVLTGLQDAFSIEQAIDEARNS